MIINNEVALIKNNELKNNCKSLSLKYICSLYTIQKCANWKTHFGKYGLLLLINMFLKMLNLNLD